MAKKTAKTTAFSGDMPGTGSAAAPKQASASRTQKHLKSQAVGVVAAVEGFVNAITNTPVEKEVPAPVETVVAAPVAAVEVKRATHEEIAALAYSFYLNRGIQGGSQAEDWLRAEQTLLSA